jgi:hypothetical protein
MTHVNNILNVRVNNVASAASINFGNVLHKGHQANVKANIGFAQMGDAFGSPVNFVNSNVANDPDAVDQQQAQV